MSDNNDALEALKRTILQNRMKQRMALHATGKKQQGIPRADRGAPLPLSSAQQRLWFLDQLDRAAGAAYHVSAVLRLVGALDQAALRASLDRIVARHENLRTTFVNAGGSPVQVIAPEDIGFALADQDLRDLDAGAQVEAVADLSASDAHAPFDLSRGPLIRGRLLKLAEHEHVLLVTQHHIVSDGWSTAILVKEFSALYAAFCRGEPDPLPPLPIQYADYAVWQRQWLQGDVLQGQLDFWREHLAGAPALLELPVDHPRPEVPSYAGSSVDVNLSLELTAALRALSQRHGVTLFMTLLAAWAVLLSRLSGQDDIVIGSPVANRARAEIEPLVGFFVNTLALRVDLSADPSVAQLLAQIKATTLGAYAHADLPFEQVVEALQPERSLSYSPVFQVLLSMSNDNGDRSLHLPGLALEQIEAPYNNAHFDLDLAFFDSGNSLTGKLTYSSDLFDRSTVARFNAYLVAVLTAMASDAAQATSSLSLLSPSERQQMLFAFNATDTAYPHLATIHALFEAQAAQQPDADALEYAGDRLSYAALNRRANAVAHRLIAMGVTPGDRVAICAERSLTMVVGVLGVLKAGAAYVPLDPAYPADRLAYMLADSAPMAVLTQAALSARLPMLDGLDVPAIVLDAEVDDAVLDAANPVVPNLTSREVAYVIYTSGSTGQPKGVMVEHRSAVNFWQAMTRTTHRSCGPNARVALNAAFSFDMSLKGLLQLLSGHCLVLIPQAIRASGPALLAFLEEQRIDAFDSTPSQLEGLLSAGLLEPGGHRPRNVLLGGEAIGAGMWERLKASPVVRFHNMYGPTEATVDATIEDIGASVAGPVIGKPLANARIYLLDARGEPVPLGVAGEIHIGGVGVARGYLHRPDLTAERFVKDRFSDDPQARMYRTGDLGRWRADGTLEYLGRNDFQVKIRGFRIELGEIEAKLRGCAGVREAVVIAREDVEGDKRLIAYVVAQEHTELSIAGLREELSQDLPEYMIPGACVLLPALPLTPNGKLDRKALPAPDQAAVASRAYEAPIGEAEQAIAEVWQTLLGLERVGRHDHFFELGGHSLLVIGVIEQLRQRGLSLDVRAIFMTPTLSALAAQLGGGSQTPERGEVPQNRITLATTAITPDLLPLVDMTQDEIDSIVASVPGGVANIQDIYPLAPLQEGILFHHLLENESGGDTYLLNTMVAFDGRERLDAFLDALQRVIDRHDILRSAMHWQDLATPVQVVQRRVTLPIHELLLSDDSPAQAQLLAHADPRRMRLDLRQAPILAAHIARDPATGEWLLALLNHHITCDHIAQDLILSEIQMLLQGRQDALPAPMPYRDFIARTLAVSEAEHETYFRSQLADVDEPTVPFGVLSVQADENGDFDEARARIDTALSRHIRDSARKHGVTPAVLFHVAWAQVLAQCSGRDDVVFGTVLSGRLQETEAAEHVVGMFINTLPVRIPLAGVGVADAVRDTHRRLAELLPHEQTPLALAQRCSGIQPPLPLFAALFNYRHSHEVSHPDDIAERVSAWEGVWVLGGYARTNYPLTVSVDDFGQDFGLAIWSAPGIDSARLLRYMEIAVAGLTDALADAPAMPLLGLDILSAAEREQVLVGFNATRAEYPQDATICALFESQAARDPDAVALECEGWCLSYDALNSRANRLAHRLIAAGVRPDDRVAIFAERGLAMVVGMLGVLKAGGAYVPMDPAYPAERLAYMMADAEPIALLTEAESRDALALPAAMQCPVLMLDDDERGALPEHSANPLVAGLTSRHLAYVIYTSGSTGRPKGVMVEHRNVLRLVINNPYAPIGLDDCIGHCSNPAFDASTWEIWAALLNGARSLVVPQRIVLDPQALNQALVDGNATALWLTAGLFNEYVNALGLAFAGLKYLLIGGDVLDPRRVARVLNGAQPPRHLINGYGPTETTTFATTFAIEALPDGARTIPIGRPIANTQAYVLGTHGEAIPVGVVGELHIGGAGVARGYLNNAALTAERFLRDPFSAEPGARMYRTGDLARWLPDGNLEYLGRNDCQVKIRGFRIELGEIETTLRACADVCEAVVSTREDASGDKRLVAYVVPRGGADPSTLDLRAVLARELPDYMIPAAFVYLDALPLTPNGKLDRKSLPAPGQAAVASRDYEPPVGDIEQTIAGIWQELLELEQVGRHDHFFELGGHSLLAVRLTTRLRAALGTEVALRDVFAQPTLAMLARTVSGAAPSHGAIMPISRDQALPVSWSQQRLWFLDRLDRAAGAAYHIPAALRLSGGLNRSALQASLDGVVARHEVLRTRFVDIEGTPHQAIAPAESGFALTEHDLRDLDAAAQAAVVAEWSADEARAQFDLAMGPLIRGRLLRLAEEEHVLLVTQHHIVSDGWSIGVLVREVSALYTAFCQGEPDPLPPLPIQYADYAAWQRQWLQGDVLQGQLDFWREHLNGAPALLELPTDRPRPAVQSYRGDRIEIRLPEELSVSLHALSQRHDVTLFMVLQASWAVLLARLSGQDQVVIGSPVANRPRAEIEPLIGFFVNTLALRVDLAADPSLAELLAQIKATTLGAYAHQDLPFEQVVEALRPERNLGHNALFQVWLNLNNTPNDALSLPGLTLSTIDTEQRTARVDLSLSLTDLGDGLISSLVYSTDLFDRSTAGRILGHWTTLLEAIVGAGAQPVSCLPLLSSAERQQMLFAFNATDTAYPHLATIHALFEAQAAQQPDADALEYAGDRLSYAALNRRANAVAHRLIAMGVTPGDRVAICAERSLAMVVGVLGVLKAGAAYVPLDPAYPADRLAYMLADSAPMAVLTQAALSARLPMLDGLDVPAIVLDAEVDDAVLDAANPVVPNLTSREVAYVIYTSGSTGQPKGVMVEHRSAVNFWQAMTRTTHRSCGPNARVALNAAFSFDMSLKGLLQLLSGHCLVLIPQAIRASGPALLAFLEEQRIDAFDSTPSQLEGLLSAGLLEPGGHRPRNVLLGGEAIGAGMWERLKASPVVRFHNMYGPTEATVDATIEDIGASVAGPVIGKPLANARIYLLDARGEPVPLGVAGEIHIGGVGVARGYLHRPDLTAERFVKDRFSDDPQARMYRTGDLGRWRADGTLEYLGRNDFQVKIRGFRIELGEIEAKLRGCAGVREAVVIAREDVEGDKRLIAYVVAQEHTELSIAGLREQLLQDLPEYMIPSACVLLPALPLTPNGKLDRKALPAPDQAAVASRAYEAPAGEIEQGMAAIWQELLNLQRVGRNDHFFELGGHSLLVMQLVIRIREQFHVDVPLRVLFEQPVFSALAEVVVCERLKRFADADVAAAEDELSDLSEEELLAMLASDSDDER